MKERGRSKVSDELRAQIIYEYEHSHLSQLEVCQKYGLKDRAILAQWLRRRKKSCENEAFSLSSHRHSNMVIETMSYATPEEEIAALKAKLLQVENERDQAKKQAHAYKRMIEIAEEHGIPVRKNSGAKQ